MAWLACHLNKELILAQYHHRNQIYIFPFHHPKNNSSQFENYLSFNLALCH